VTPVELTVPSVLATPVLPWYVMKILIAISYSNFHWGYAIIGRMKILMSCLLSGSLAWWALSMLHPLLDRNI
jgi:hypothetical protein